MMTCGEHLGVFVGTDILACPKGWVFIPLADATPALVRQAIEHANRGRKNWPKNQKAKYKSDDEMLEQVFSSQDYIGN